MKAQGHCLCGSIHFEAQGDPRFVAHCHCESCRRQTGSVPATFVGYREDQVQYARQPPQEFESSPGIYRGFCPRCGSALHYRPGAAKELHLYLGAFNNPSQFQPTKHVFYNEHVTSLELLDNLPRFDADYRQPVAWGHAPTRNILFLCTGNSARSIIAEAITNRFASSYTSEAVRAYSAGSQPVGQVNPDALALLQARGIDHGQFTSKSWDQFKQSGAPEFEWIITLCDSAANEQCPVFAGQYERLHWGLPDPASGEVSFDETYASLEQQISTFLSGLK